MVAGFNAAQSVLLHEYVRRIFKAVFGQSLSYSAEMLSPVRSIRTSESFIENRPFLVFIKMLGSVFFPSPKSRGATLIRSFRASSAHAAQTFMSMISLKRGMSPWLHPLCIARTSVPSSIVGAGSFFPALDDV